MADRYVETYADFGGEKSTLSLPIAAITSANYDAKMTLVGALRTAIGLLTEGLSVKKVIHVESVGSGSGKATSPTAQRELKWLVSYQDATTLKRLTCEIPAPLLTAAFIDTTPEGNAILTATEWVDFIADFEAIVVAPDTDNAVEILAVRLVGRNN